MAFNLSRGISALILFGLGICSASQTTMAAERGSISFGAYALAAKNSEQVKEVLEYDKHRHVTKDMIIPAWGLNKGLKIVAYYPGKNIRMKATGEWDRTIATYYRKNGSRDCVLDVGYGLTIVDWYNDTGTKKVLEQYWFRADSIKETDQWRSPVKHQYKLWDVIQMDRSGNPLHEYAMRGDYALPWFITEYNVKNPGDSLSFIYDQDGKLTLTAYQRTQRSKITREEHVPAEGIVAQSVPTNLLRAPSHLDEDDFPEFQPYFEYH
jgi:hypothetical protein